MSRVAGLVNRMFPPPVSITFCDWAGGSSTDIDWSVMSVPGGPPGVSCRPVTVLT